ncbi:hypothetical protein H8356DRAFT_1324391 [Neocallimastix lanati (nom. inval.)]|nr:hypothetical protein H8356DRAFT_1324391 [Neocallimastix sp. JGI-2020a]
MTLQRQNSNTMPSQLKLCSQVWSKLLKLPLIKYLEKKHNPNVYLDTKILNEIILVYEKINKEEYKDKDEFYSLVMEIINKFGLICKPKAQVYMDYNNLKLIFNSEWKKCLNILKLNKVKNHQFKGDSNHINSNRVVIPSTSFSSPPPAVKHKGEKKDSQKNEKKELSISYKLYSKFFKPEFNMEAINVGDKVESKLVTHIMTNHQDKLTVISDYYCSICGKRLPDIVTQLIHNVEHQYNKRRKIFSKKYTSNATTTSSSLLNPLNSITNSFMPINTSLSQSSLPIHQSTIKNKSISSKSSKLKRKYPFDKSDISNHLNNVNSSKLNNIKIIVPLSPSPASSLSKNIHTSPTKIDNKKLKNHTNETLKESNDNKILANTLENKSKRNISGKINNQQYKDNMVMSSSTNSHSKSENSSSTVSYTRSKLRIPCVVETCLKTHISRYHPEVHVNIEELKNKKAHNILPVTNSSHPTFNASTSSDININADNNNVSKASNLFSIENNPLLNIPSDTMNNDKSLSSNLLNNLIKGKIIPNDTEDNKKDELNSFDNNSMNIDDSLDNLRNLENLNLNAVKLGKPDLLSAISSHPSSNNINNIGNPTLPINNLNDLNLLNMNYNPLNYFSLYGSNLNSLNNTQLQLLLNNNNSEDNHNKTDNLSLNVNNNFNTTNTSHTNSDILINEKATTTDFDESDIKTEDISSSIIRYRILNNLLINNNNLTEASLDLIDLNPSMTNTKSLDSLSNNTLIPDLKDIDMKNSIDETLEIPKSNRETENKNLTSQ